MSAGFGSYLDSTGRSEPDYIDRTIATVRNHRDAENCWPQWANIFADEIEALRAELVSVRAEREQAAEAYEGRLANALAVARQLRDALERARALAGYIASHEGHEDVAACMEESLANAAAIETVISAALAATEPPQDREGRTAIESAVAEGSPVAPPGALCPGLSQRADGKHAWKFDGDDPYIVCVFCGERRDALTGLAAGGVTPPEPNA